MIKIKNVTYKHLKECLNALLEDADIEVTTGSLLDNYKIYKEDINFSIENEFIDFIRKFKEKFDILEFREVYLSSWDSGYIVILS